MNNIAMLYGLSFLGGIIASVSPCSLAMLPIIVGFIGGYSKEKPSKTFIQMIFFVAGSAVIFSIIGIICALTGKVFVAFAGGYFGLVMASIIMIMGLKLVGVLDFELPVIIKEMPNNNSHLYLSVYTRRRSRSCRNAVFNPNISINNGICCIICKPYTISIYVIFVCNRTGLDINPCRGNNF